MEFLIIGVVAAANLVFILFKVEKKRYPDALLDFTLLVTVTGIAMGSYGGLVVSTIASLIISIYLYAKPPRLPTIFSKSTEHYISNIDIDKELNNFVEEFKRKAARRSK